LLPYLADRFPQQELDATLARWAGADLMLCCAALIGDATAVRPIAEHLQPAIVAALRRLKLADSEVDELTQIVWERLLVARDGKPVSSRATWPWQPRSEPTCSQDDQCTDTWGFRDKPEKCLAGQGGAAKACRIACVGDGDCSVDPLRSACHKQAGVCAPRAFATVSEQAPYYRRRHRR
jgi:hypothetical protein